MFNKTLKKALNYSVISSSGFLIMFMPKCSFPYFFKNKCDEDVVKVFQRVMVDDTLDAELKKLEEDDDDLLLLTDE